MSITRAWFTGVGWVLALVAAVTLLTMLAARMWSAERHARVQLAMLARVASDAQELSRLRTAELAREGGGGRGAPSDSPAPQLAPAVSGALASCGLPAAALSSLSPESESIEQAAGAPHAVRMIRARATLVLTPVTLPQLGRFLQAWRERSPRWTVTRLDIEPRFATAGQAAGQAAASPGADLPLRVVIGIESLSLDHQRGTR